MPAGKIACLAPKLRGREASKEDKNLIFNVLENIAISNASNKVLLKFYGAKAAERVNISSEAVLGNRWSIVRQKFGLNDNLPINPSKAQMSSVEPQLRGEKATASALNIILSILENLKEKVTADWAKVAERAGLKSEDEALQAWGNLCAEYQLFNEEDTARETTNELYPRPPRVVVANKVQPAFISVAGSISVLKAQQTPPSACTPISPTVADVPSTNTPFTAPSPALASSPVEIQAVTGRQTIDNPQPHFSGAQINISHSVNKQPADYASIGTQTDAKCCPSKAFGFRVVLPAICFGNLSWSRERLRRNDRRDCLGSLSMAVPVTLRLGHMTLSQERITSLTTCEPTCPKPLAHQQLPLPARALEVESHTRVLKQKTHVVAWPTLALEWRSCTCLSSSTPLPTTLRKRVNLVGL